MKNTALDLINANKIFCDHQNDINIFSNFAFFHNEHKMKPINFTKWQMAVVC